MKALRPKSLRFQLPAGEHVSALLLLPPRATGCYVMAHGAGAGMSHPFMAAVAEGLAERGLATLRYQFLYMEKGGKRPDSPRVAHTVVRAAVAEAARRLPALRIFAGGKSFGGRMTSQAQAAAPLPGVIGMIFLGFPLHRPGEPSTSRADHLFATNLPLLLLQGTRDHLAEPPRLRALCRKLGRRATLVLVEGADHSFHGPVRSGRHDDEVRDEMLDMITCWCAQPEPTAKRKSARRIRTQ